MADKLISTKFLYALELVAQLFQDHKRVIGRGPYVSHLYGVCYIVQQLIDDEDTHLAALLHDVLEDIPSDKYSSEQMEADFGSEVLRLVQASSYDEARYGKDEARRQYTAQRQKASVNACLISGADMLHNGRDFMYWYNLEPEKTAAAFGRDRIRRRNWFLLARFKVIEARLGADHLLVTELRRMLKKLEAIHQKIM